MRVNAPEVAQHVEMKRGSLDGFGPAFAQAVEVPFGRGQFGIAQRGLLGQKLSRLVDVSGHEDAERDPKRIHGALVEGGQFLGALGRELEPALDLLGCKLAQILVDDVADMLEVDGEGDDLHRPLSLTLVETAAGELGDIELDWSTSARSLVIIAAITLRSMIST